VSQFPVGDYQELREVLGGEATKHQVVRSHRHHCAAAKLPFGLRVPSWRSRLLIISIQRELNDLIGNSR